jgi:hypothetical protein
MSKVIDLFVTKAKFSPKWADAQRELFCEQKKKIFWAHGEGASVLQEKNPLP